ncbi:Orotate phosphoribosyltransferase [Sebaldella termitidis]|uniref:Orotate phosphoribosyltransferase n=1 Tax=Sebaldella termitidis (strain ATCC 33386 / NCTC 11300) TaxID=526218 RepID=D1AMD3_SEBTE|nr:orotate phosphoribosyltransferase [Sebaldella termitidis]ACZ09507.1 orotate phosphoribosyltransferase [Sebaldella termitidis ATCC 33386]SUI24837.1 Orotate phosphoribosyltransferase [Sebaldella termitidis]
MNKKEQTAKILFDLKAVKINVKEPFTFSSGIKSPIYCDNRVILGYPEAREQIVQGFLDIIDTENTDVIAGVATAGISWAAFIAEKLGKPMAYVRSKPKGHGVGRQIEGAETAGKRVAVIEDLISTGGSSINAAEVLRNSGADSVEVKAIFSYNFKSAFENFEKINCKWDIISDFDILIELLKNEKYLNETEAKTALEWNKNPESWGK